MHKLYFDAQNHTAYLDGVEIQGLQRIETRMGVNEMPTVTIELVCEMAGPESLKVNQDQAWIRVR